VNHISVSSTVFRKRASNCRDERQHINLVWFWVPLVIQKGWRELDLEQVGVHSMIRPVDVRLPEILDGFDDVAYYIGVSTEDGESALGSWMVYTEKEGEEDGVHGLLLWGNRDGQIYSIPFMHCHSYCHR
jgi:hypothetical protein